MPSGLATIETSRVAHRLTRRQKGAGRSERFAEPTGVDRLGRGGVVEVRVEADEPGSDRLRRLRGQQEPGDLIGDPQPLLALEVADLGDLAGRPARDGLAVRDAG